EFPEGVEHPDRPVGLVLVVTAQRVAGIVPAEERLHPCARAATPVGHDQRPGDGFPAVAAEPYVVEGEERAVRLQDDLEVDLLDAEPELGDLLIRVVFEPPVVADEGRQQATGGRGHRRTPLSLRGGTSTTPSRRTARKKWGVMPSLKSMSCSM